MGCHEAAWNVLSSLFTKWPPLIHSSINSNTSATERPLCQFCSGTACPSIPQAHCSSTRTLDSSKPTLIISFSLPRMGVGLVMWYHQPQERWSIWDVSFLFTKEARESPCLLLSLVSEDLMLRTGAAIIHLGEESQKHSEPDSFYCWDNWLQNCLPPCFIM